MKYLLDTHILVWWVKHDRKLKPQIRSLVENPQNHIFVSVVNAWEITIKQKKGKLHLKTTLENTFNEPGFELIPITFDHVLNLHQLPLHHKDPFDRMLVAQAISEKLTLITHDQKLKKYKVNVILT